MKSEPTLSGGEIGKTIYMLVGGIIGLIIFFLVFNSIDTLGVQKRIIYASLPFIIFLAFWSAGRLIGE